MPTRQARGPDTERTVTTDDTEFPTPDGLMEQRRSLYETLLDLEAALADAGPGRVEDWTAAVGLAMDKVAEAFAAHVRFTEDPDGLFDDVIHGTPGLAHAVETLRTDHRRIQACLDHNVAALAGGVSGDPEAWVDRIRASAGDLMGQLAHHRQKGSDLTYAAFWTDDGGSG